MNADQIIRALERENAQLKHALQQMRQQNRQVAMYTQVLAGAVTGAIAKMDVPAPETPEKAAQLAHDVAWAAIQLASGAGGDEANGGHPGASGAE